MPLPLNQTQKNTQNSRFSDKNICSSTLGRRRPPAAGQSVCAASLSRPHTIPLPELRSAEEKSHLADPFLAAIHDGETTARGRIRSIAKVRGTPFVLLPYSSVLFHPFLFSAWGRRRRKGMEGEEGEVRGGNFLFPLSGHFGKKNVG